MSKLTSQQRKLAYLVLIVVLLVPIYLIGAPSTGEVDSGGELARLKREYDLGEEQFGNVDPSSATINLVLLGLRGVAANILWVQHDEQKNNKDWAAMRATTESIIMLQPHYMHVWRYHGWDLAYNVSAEWDAVPDRYYWVKEGAKFSMRGTKRNAIYTELYWETGRILGQKIGRADEWEYFRDYFLSDPFREDGQADPDINPSAKDNYLAARDWYQQANEAELNREQHIMMRALFRSYPARSTLDRAMALQREGEFDEVARIAWQEGYNDWTGNYGLEEFQAPQCTVILEADNDDIRRLAERAKVDIATVNHWTEHYRKVTNYRYWRTRASSEGEANTIAMHRKWYEGQDAFKAGDLTEARRLLEEGMDHFVQLVSRYPMLQTEDETIEEALTAVLLWKKLLEWTGEDSSNFPLKGLWDKEQGRVESLRFDLERQFGEL